MIDFIVIGTASALVQRFIMLLAQRFSLKNLGDVHYFLGVEAIPCSQYLFLFPHKYIEDMLAKTGMHATQLVPTHLSIYNTLILHDYANPPYATLYRQMLGSLQYLSLIRQDISLTFNRISEFMHRPSAFHYW